MENLKKKVHETGSKAAEKFKNMPENTRKAVKELPGKTKDMAVRTLNEMQRRTRVKLIVAVIVIVLVILIAGGILNGGHLWYTKKI